MKFADLRMLLSADKARLSEHYDSIGIPKILLTISPAWICVLLYRLSQYCYQNNFRLSARFLWQINLFLTGADISPICDIGPGLIVLHPCAVTIVGSAGARLTIEGLSGLGGGMNLRDIGAGPGLPLLGDDVIMRRGSMVLGPVVIGNNVLIGPGLTLCEDVPNNSEVLAHRIRIVRRSASDSGRESDLDRELVSG